MMYGTEIYGWNFGLGYFYMFIFGGLLVWLVIWIITKTTQTNKKHESPLNTLKRRLAKGEITKKEFDGLKIKI